MEHRPATAQSIDAAELAAAIVAERAGTAPQLFTPDVVAAFRNLAAEAVHKPGCDPGELRTGVWEMRHDVHSPATGSHAIAGCVTAMLPRLPAELEYRSAGTVLLLVDAHAHLVVDIMPALLAGSEIR